MTRWNLINSEGYIEGILECKIRSGRKITDMRSDVKRFVLDLVSEIKESDYWKKRCELSEIFISKSPCDPDITKDQLAAFNTWQNFIFSESEA